MQIKDLIPWNRRGSDLTGDRKRDEGSPVLSLQRDINRVFDDFWRRFESDLGTWGGFGGSLGALNVDSPRTDVAETDRAFEISVELPGMDEKDLDVSITNATLTIRGEKKAEREENKKGYHLSERSYGSFYRSIPLPPGVDTDNVNAEFRKGVLTITVPKTGAVSAQSKRIEVRAA